MSEEATPEPRPSAGAAESGAAPPADAEPRSAESPKAEPRALGDESDGPVSEQDALRSLASDAGPDAAERSEAQRASAIADLIAARLNADASGTSIGTLALFNDTVSFGGGFHTASRGPAPGRGTGATTALDSGELQEYTELFVHPEGYGTALDDLREQVLLVLTGPPGSGRSATAVNLLSEATALNGARDGGCHRLLDPSVLTEPGWEPPTKNCGYLVEVDDGIAGAREFGARQLRSVAAALRAAGCLMVVTGGHDLALAATSPAGTEMFARHSLAPPDPLAILERRVLGHAPEPEVRDRLHRLLESVRAVDALREQPAARHAARLASVVTTKGDLAKAVAALRDPSDQVRSWFQRHRSGEPVAFALAAAVLEGSSYLTVAEAAVKLHTALTPPEPAPPDLRFADRLGHEQQWIRLESSDVGPLGAGGPPHVRFRNALLGQAILVHAWTTLDGRRDAVLEWLRRLLAHRDLEVRARASVAAGVLAWADHHYAVHRFLTGWAGGTSWPARQAAATALGVAGSRPESAEAVWELLDSWARGGSSAYQRRLAGTAANAVGGLLGRSAPHRAVAVLHSALDRGDDWGTLPSVAWGGVHLIHQGQAGTLLDAYLDWSEAQDLSPMVVKTLSAFVFAVSQPYERPPSTETEVSGVPGVPLLLSSLPEHRDQITELWARALARRPVQDSALPALREWIDTYAPRCPSGLDRVAALLSDVAHQPGKHRDRLLWWLDKWADDRDHPSVNALWLRGRI
ncbi:NACHT domain-containing protein [Streptomyces sp. O3]